MSQTSVNVIKLSGVLIAFIILKIQKNVYLKIIYLNVLCENPRNPKEIYKTIVTVVLQSPFIWRRSF